jgi:pimeloyl-ACP methyl ester carboxylesterase
VTIAVVHWCSTSREEFHVATYLLIHGGGHGGWCYQRVARILRGAGHEVHAPSLTGLGDRSHLVRPGIDLDTHITDVVNLLHYEDLRDVILAGHSYGGMVITGVADRAAERVGRLVYLDAANPADGESLVDVAGQHILAIRALGRTVDGVELVLFPDPDIVALYGVTDPDTVTWMVERLTPNPWACFEQKLRLTNEDGLRSIPQFHVVCSATVATRDPEMIERARAEGRFWEIDTGHDLMITEPEWVADVLQQVACYDVASSA